MLKIIEDADADFICLQEVTNTIKEHFLNSDYIKAILQQGGTYSGNNVWPYGTMIISKYPCVFFECDFPTSRMGRKLILAEAYLPFHLIVATSHFESLNKQRERCSQL